MHLKYHDFTHLPIGPFSQSLSHMYSFCRGLYITLHIFYSSQQPRAFSVLVVIRATLKQAAGVKLAIDKVVQFITGDSHHVPMVSLSLDVSPQHHRTLIGSGGGNIKSIMERSNTT